MPRLHGTCRSAVFPDHGFAVLGDFAHFFSGSKSESTVQADPPTAHSVIILPSHIPSPRWSQRLFLTCGTPSRPEPLPGSRIAPESVSTTSLANLTLPSHSLARLKPAASASPAADLGRSTAPCVPSSLGHGLNAAACASPHHYEPSISNAGLPSSSDLFFAHLTSSPESGWSQIEGEQ